jgi:multidrug resistance protein, MATE family
MLHPGGEGGVHVWRTMVPGRGDLGELLRLALPVVTVQLGVMLMGVVDTVMVGHVSPGDLAAVALGNLYFFTVAIFGMGVLLSLDPVISQAVGAADGEAVVRGVQRGALLAIALTVIATLLFLPARPVLELLRQPAEVVPIATGYVHASLPGLLPFYLYIVLRQTLQALGRVAPVVITVIVANLANVLFNWVLVYGNLGLPALGAVGAGWASTLSRVLMIVGILGLAWPVLRPHLRHPRRAALERGPLARMLHLGVPIGFQLQLEWGAFAVVGLIMGLLGTVAMAGHQVAINLASLTFMVPLGIAQAASVLVGRAVGREDVAGARRAAGAGLAVGGAFMTLTAVVFLTVPGPLARIYTNDLEVARLAALLLPIAGLFQVFDGIQVVATSVLRGIGDTRVPMVLHVLGFWLVGLPVSLWVGFGLGAGPVGLWWGLASGLGVVAVLLLLRVGRRFSGELRRLVMEEGLSATAPVAELPIGPAARRRAAGGAP